MEFGHQNVEERRCREKLTGRCREEGEEQWSTAADSPPLHGCQPVHSILSFYNVLSFTGEKFAHKLHNLYVNCETNLLNLINSSLLNIYCSTLLLNYAAIRFKRFVSQFARRSLSSQLRVLSSHVFQGWLRLVNRSADEDVSVVGGCNNGSVVAGLLLLGNGDACVHL